MSLEAELWREVCLHLELEESAARVFEILRRHVPIEAILLRRIDDERGRVETVAVGASHSAAAAHRWPRLGDLTASARRALQDLFDTGMPRVLEADRGLLARLLLPAESRSRSAVALPLVSLGKAVGIATLVVAPGNEFSPLHLEKLVPAAQPLSVAFENDRRLHELSTLRAGLEADRAALLSRLHRDEISDTVIGASAGLADVMERVEQVARTDVPVLILGETGSGKEVIARAVHDRSSRAAGPIVRVNCGAIPAELVDSELFGHEKGAFTGATSTRKGWFERADGGTLFLDEIGELSPAAQVRLLRVLQDGTLERVGGQKTIRVDVRIVGATHRRLEAMIAERTFREDLWFRLSVFPIRLPALRERQEDLPELAAHFALRAGRRLGGAGLHLEPSDIEVLRRYSWPGNVRELAAVIDRAAILGDGRRLDLRRALGTSDTSTQGDRSASGVASTVITPGSNAAPLTLDAAMRAHIEHVLSTCHGRIEGPFGAARALAINPHTLRARMRKLGIDWASFRKG